jgi:F0F1-type ATP synthase epsilon subunit
MTMNSGLTLKAIFPEGLFFEETQLSEVVVPLADGGSIGIRINHTPLIAETVSGPIRYRSQSGEGSLELMAGVLNIRDNIVTVLTAGSVEEPAETVSQTPESEYDRLIQTLVNDFAAEQIPEEGADK